MNNESLAIMIFCATIGICILGGLIIILLKLCAMQKKISDWAQYNRELVLWLEEDDDPDPDPGEDVPEEVEENVVRLDRKNAA